MGDRVPGVVERNLFDIDAKFGDVEPLAAWSTSRESSRSRAGVRVPASGRRLTLMIKSGTRARPGQIVDKSRPNAHFR